LINSYNLTGFHRTDSAVNVYKQYTTTIAGECRTFSYCIIACRCHLRWRWFDIRRTSTFERRDHIADTTFSHRSRAVRSIYFYWRPFLFYNNNNNNINNNYICVTYYIIDSCHYRFSFFFCPHLGR